MKVALCVSGQLRGDWRKNLERLKECFPTADVFTATWGQNDSVTYSFEEPTIHYHPVLDTEPYQTHKAIEYKKRCATDDGLKDKTSHRTKQILAHDMMLDKIDNDYDIIVRTRFDCIISPEIDWNKYLEQSLEENCALGFGIRSSRWSIIEVIKEIPQYWCPVDKPVPATGINQTNDWNYFLLVILIIHPRSLWDGDEVKRLHEEKELKVAEWGWYQVLSTNDNHRSFYGGCKVR